MGADVSELLILGFMLISLLFLWVWPYIRVEHVVHLPDNWNPEASRGRVCQRVGGGYWRVEVKP